ncbi:MAG: SDR family oxidoreductase [Bacteroidota bacterium]
MYRFQENEIPGNGILFDNNFLLMIGKRVLVTGANAGIGFETASALAGKGAEVWLLCRTEEKAQGAMARILAIHPDAQLFWLAADLSSQHQIAQAATAFRSERSHLDVLVNNAGAWFSKRGLSEDGIEMQWAINHMAYFLLAKLLLPSLEAAPEGRIINVGSDSHFNGKMPLEDVQFTNRTYSGLAAYAQSKLANVLFTYELARRLEGKPIVVNCLQPGLVFTNIGLKHTTPIHALAWKVRRSFWKSKTPAEGAETSIFLASSPEATFSGKYVDLCKPKPSSDISYDEKLAKDLWTLSESLIIPNIA